MFVTWSLQFASEYQIIADKFNRIMNTIFNNTFNNWKIMKCVKIWYI